MQTTLQTLHNICTYLRILKYHVHIWVQGIYQLLLFFWGQTRHHLWKKHVRDTIQTIHWMSILIFWFLNDVFWVNQKPNVNVLNEQWHLLKILICHQGKWLQKYRVFHIVYSSLVFKKLQVCYIARMVLLDICTGQTSSEMQYDVHILFLLLFNDIHFISQVSKILSSH